MQSPSTPTNVAPPPPASRFRPWRWIWGTLLAGAALAALLVAFLLWYSYAEGERAGVLQKFSKRGWVCKTNEGELAQYVVGGVAPQIWYFSVRDESVAAQLHQAVGQQVRLHYAEHRHLPTSCFGETDYFVTSFEVVGPVAPVTPSSGLAPPPSPPPPQQP
jgi:hypothetical protein